MWPIERAAHAAYQSWISGVECMEPAWNDLPQDFRDRLIEAQRAAILALAECVLPASALKAADAAVEECKAHEFMDTAFRAICRAIASEGGEDDNA